MAGAVAIREISAGDSQVYYYDKPLYSANPRDSARRRVARLSVQPDSLVLWSSPLLWYGLDELLRSLPAGARVFAIERDPQLLDLTKRHMPNRDERVSLFDGEAESVQTMLALVDASRLRRVVELTTSSAAMTHRSEYRDIVRLLERQIRITWQNRRTLQAMSRLWIRNIQRNLTLLPLANPPADLNRDTVVVCGAGPSLEKSVGFMREVRERVTIVAVDTALPVLHAHGLAPDIVVALEGQLYNAYDFLPVSDRNYILISDLTASAHVVQMHRKVTWTLSMFDSTAFVKRVATLPGIFAVLPPLGSVGVAAVDIAQRLSSGRILLSGLDFAVQPGKTHARGAPSYLYGMAQSRRLAPVRDRGLEVLLHEVTGARGSVGTTQVLLGYARELERIADASRCVVLEPEGAALSLPRVDVDEALGLTPNATMRHTQMRAHDESLVAGRAAKVKQFVSREIDLLEGFLVRDATSPDDRPLEDCDYVTTDSGFSGLDAKDLARTRATRINAEYYLSHWKLARRLLAERY